MSDNHLTLIAIYCKAACANEPDIAERIKKSMREVAQSFWMGGDDDLRFRGAVGGALLADETTDEEKERIQISLDAIRAVSAMSSGVPVDIDAVFERMENANPLPLIKLWQEAKKETTPESAA